MILSKGASAARLFGIARRPRVRKRALSYKTESWFRNLIFGKDEGSEKKLRKDLNRFPLCACRVGIVGLNIAADAL
jgi:hypothetical protein